MHGIPSRFMNRGVTQQICESVGTVCRLQNTIGGDGGGFMRVRVIVDVFQPLYRGRMISLDDGKEQWISFNYERLLNLCYWYGHLTHDDRDCELWIDSEGILDTESQ